MPVLAIALAVTPPSLLYAAPEEANSKRRRLAPWKGLAHAASVVAAVLWARFAIFDNIHWLSGARPEVCHLPRPPGPPARATIPRTVANHWTKGSRRELDGTCVAPGFACWSGAVTLSSGA